MPPYHLAWHGLNKAVGLLLKRQHLGSVADMFYVCNIPVADMFHYADGFKLTSHLGTLCFCSSDCLHISIHVTSFTLFFF